MNYSVESKMPEDNSFYGEKAFDTLDEALNYIRLFKQEYRIYRISFYDYKSSVMQEIVRFNYISLKQNIPIEDMRHKELGWNVEYNDLVNRHFWLGRIL
jgi:hypothetical protein